MWYLLIFLFHFSIDWIIFIIHFYLWLWKYLLYECRIVCLCIENVFLYLGFEYFSFSNHLYFVSYVISFVASNVLNFISYDVSCLNYLWCFIIIWCFLLIWGVSILCMVINYLLWLIFVSCNTILYNSSSISLSCLTLGG